MAYHQSLAIQIPRAQVDGDVYLIGLFSICLEGADTNHQGGQTFKWENISSYTESANQNSSYFRRDALNMYLNFEKAVTAGNYLNDKHQLKTLHFGTISYDVCNQKNRLLEILLKLVLSPGYFHLNPNYQPVSLRYVAIYGYMDNHLTKLAGQILFFSTVPFIAVSDQPERMLARNIFPLYNQIGIQKQDANQLKKVFDTFGWRSITIITLTQSQKHSERTDDLYNMLVENGGYCVYKMGNKQPHNITNTVLILKERPDLKIIYAMGDPVSSLNLLKLLDENDILDRIIFLDKQFITALKYAPARLVKGLFLTSSFFDRLIPPFIKFMACNNTWFNKVDQQSPINEQKCKSNPGLLIRDLYDMNTGFGKITKMFDFAVALPIMLSTRSSSQYLFSQIRDIVFQTYKYFQAGYYLINLDMHPKPFSIIQVEFKLKEDSFIWPNYFNNTPPSSKCVNHRPAPPGMFQIFGPINSSDTRWEKEFGWYYKKCPSGTIKEDPGNGSCSKCPRFQISNSDNTQCFDPYKTINVFNFETYEGVMSIILVILIAIISLAFMSCYIFHRNTPVVKSSQLAFTNVQLVSHLLIALASALGQWLDHPVICTSNAGIIGVLLTLNLATTIVKTQTVLTIFKSRRKISVNSKMRYKQQRYIILIVSLIISLLLSIVLLVKDIPEISMVMDHEELTRFRYCDLGNHLQIQYIFITFLSIICTLQSLRARRLPEYFKSTRFIVYAMYTNLVTMVVFFTLFNIQHKNKYLQTYILVFVTNLANLFILLIVHTSRVFSILDSRRNNQNNLRMLVQENIKKQQNDHFKQNRIILEDSA